jgi:Leucine-rich repeat (LRR) protein
LGKVSCSGVPFSVIPSSINSSAIYICIFKENSLRRIEDRSFFGTGISRLEVSHNLLTSLSPHALTGLERTLRELNLMDNKLPSIPRSALSKLQRLKDLNLNNNLISELRGDLDFPPNLRSSLKILTLRANFITYIDSYSFKVLQSLQHLDLSANNIFALNQMAFNLGSDSFFTPSSASSSLSPSVTVTGDDDHSFAPRSQGRNRFSHNRESSVSSSLSLPQLESLDLHGNRLKKIPFESIQNLTFLKSLDLRSNLITVTSDMIEYKGKRLSLEQLRLDVNR